jgi:hypothetical protein
MRLQNGRASKLRTLRDSRAELHFIRYGMENAQPVLLCDAALSARADTDAGLGDL